MGLLASTPRFGEKFLKGKQPLHEIPGIVPNLIHMPPGCPFAPRCSLVQSRCEVERPPLFTLEENHFCKCWLVEKDALEKHSN
jgi:oligopeptide/dipeptide ABC transporter ATP-binding protein